MLGRAGRELASMEIAVDAPDSAIILLVMSERKIVDESFAIARNRGNGVLRREVWVDRKGRVTRYNLAFINHSVFAADNGRVIGYDNAHGFHHRHNLGRVENVEFVSFEDIEAKFERDWTAIGGMK